MTLDVASRPLENPKTVMSLFPLQAGWAPPYEEALDWFQFAYAGDWVGGYVDPASTVLVQSVVMEGGPLFSTTLMHLQWSYHGMYAHLLTSSIVPPIPDHTNYRPIGWVPELRDSDIGVEGVERRWMYNPKLGMMNSLIPSLANVSMMNNLIPVLANVPLDSPTTGQAPEFKEPDSPPFGIHHPLD